MRYAAVLAGALAVPLPACWAAAPPAPGHWAFRPPVRPALPPVADRAWARTPLDTLVLGRLERAGLKPAREADRLTLLRRVTFTLTGLPPTPEEGDAFLKDERPDAYERVVERLLASPAFGERWAQHWLDVARYAETNGYELDGLRPQFWRYRDYVVRAFNADKSYDHRLIVLSSTYRQAKEPADPRARALDPDNALLSRAHRRRREGEALRDAVLHAAGTLHRAVGGPMVRVPLEPEVYDLIFTEDEPDGLWPVTADRAEHTRRSLYLFNKRNVRLPLLEAFDQPDTLSSCPVRPVSTFAPQTLLLLNSPFMHEQARAFAARVLRESGPKPAARVEWAYRLALGRPARPAEVRVALAFL